VVEGADRAGMMRMRKRWRRLKSTTMTRRRSSWRRRMARMARIRMVRIRRMGKVGKFMQQMALPVTSDRTVGCRVLRREVLRRELPRVYQPKQQKRRRRRRIQTRLR
jgi:hypothetical protein